MASYTTNLDLYKKNPATDGADTFNITTMMNDNWDKLDEWAGEINVLTGASAPATTTVGAVGQLYIELGTPRKFYICTDADSGAVNYTWLGIPSLTTLLGYATLDGNTKVTPAQASAYIVEVAGDKTLALTDAGTFQKCTSASAAVITIPTNDSVAFPVGTEIEFSRYGAGTLTFAGASGVTVHSGNSYLSVYGQYYCAVIKKLATNEWLLTGGLS